MSITGNLNFFPFSLTGLQNIDGTINGGTPIDEITILGQTTYLSSSPVDTNGNVNLDLHIPTATSSVVGLTYDFESKNNTFTADNTFNADVFITNLPLDNSLTNAVSYNTTTKELFYTPFPAGTNILPLNNVFTGHNQFQDVSVNGILDISCSDIYGGINFGTYPDGEINILCQNISRIYSDESGAEIIIDGGFSLPAIANIPSTKILYYNDASAGMITYGDISFASILASNNQWTGTNTFNNYTYFNADVSMNAKLFVNGDASFNGEVALNNDTSFYGDNFYIRANGVGAGTSPKLFIDLRNFSDYSLSSDDLTYVVQAPGKAFLINSNENRKFQRVPVDISNNNYSFSLYLNIQGLVGGYVYSSTNLTADRTLYLPNGDQFQLAFGSTYSCSFTIMTVPVLIYNIKIDRLTPDSGTTQAIFYVNNSLQTTFPFNLASASMYQVYIETYIFNGISVVEYAFVGQTNFKNHPTLQMVLDSSNTSVGKDLDLTNGALFATTALVDSIQSNTGTQTFMLQDLAFNPSTNLVFVDDIIIKQGITKIIETSGTNLTIGSITYTNTINGTNTITGVSTFNLQTNFEAQVNINQSKALNFSNNIDIERNNITFIDTTDATYLNIRKPLRLYNTSLATKSNILYFDTTTNEVSYGAAGAVGGGTTFGSYLMCDGTNFVEQSSTTYPNVLIGRNAGRSSLGRIGMAKTGGGSVFDNIMIGNEILSGSTATTGNWAIGLGTQAFRDGAGRASIGIGLYAGTDLTGTINPDNSIVINASETAILGIGGATIIAPVRNQFNEYETRYNSTTGELSYYPVSSYLIQNTAAALTNNTSAQNAFTSPFSSFNAVVGTYKVEWVWACQNMTASTRTMRALWGGTATYNLVRMYYTADTNTAITNFAGDGSTLQQGTAAVDVASASTNPSNRLNGNGIIRITGAGTIIPQIQFITAAPTNGVRMTGSYIIFTLLNTNNANSFGDWV